MTTIQVLGTFVGVPLAICGLITAAVCLSERILARRRKPDSTSIPPGQPDGQGSADAASFADVPPTPDEKEHTE